MYYFIKKSPGSSSRSNSIESPYFIRKIRPIVPPKFYPPIYDPGFELAVPDMFKIVTTYQIEYDPGFEIPIKVKPQFSQLPEPTGAEQYATPYDPGFRLPVKTEIPTSYSLEYNPGFELPVAPAIAICPQHPGAPQVYPAVYNPGFELPERQTIQPPQAYPAVYNPGFDLPETLPQSFPPSYYPEFGLSNANNRPVIPPSRPSYGLASLSYPDSELRNCEPDCEPPPAIGFIYQPSAPVEVVPTEKTEEFGTDFTECKWQE